MGHNASGSVTAVPMTVLPKLELEDMSVAHTHSLAQPSSLEAFTCNASSPNSASSTSSSSMSELFGPINEAGHSSALSENDGGDSTSTVFTTTGRYNPEHPLSASHGCSGISSAIPSPIVEEDPGMSIDEVDVDLTSDDLDLDMKPGLDGTCFSDACCQQDSSSDEVFMLRLDELLEPNTPQDFVGESGPACVDDLFPSTLNMGQDFSLLDGMNTWSAESLRDLESLPFPEDEIMQAESVGDGGEEESASQMFTQWLQTNAHWISLSDLRKIKLKTSTIESATSRLGGGKKGLMLFLKFVLVWVQNSQMKHAALENATTAAAVSPAAMQSRPRFVGTSAMVMEGLSRRDGSSALESSCVSGAHVHTLSGLSNTLSPTTAAHLCPDWISRSRWAQTPMVEHSPAIPAPISYNGGAGSPLPSTSLCSNSAWLHHSNMMRGVSPSSTSPSLRSPANGSNGRIGGGAVGDVASMMMLMQQQHCSDATPAATTRAARKSRMERQRWSARRNRKWSGAAAHQSQHRLAAAAASSAGVHVNVPAWSQVLGNSPHNLPYSSSRGCQQRPGGGRNTMDCQQSKKPERNLRLLFHKELKQSDVGNLGRIVLPKAAETCLPPLELRDGMNLLVEDMNSPKVWNMRYRFWPNNKSRMYLLENTSDFVRSYDLREGDFMMLLCDNLTNRFVIRGAPGQGQTALSSGAGCINNVRDAALVCNGAKERAGLPKEEVDLVSMGATNSEESCDDSLLAELIEQSLEDLKESSETEGCDPLVPI